jgi:iron(III) transport system substrate-binding protein
MRYLLAPALLALSLSSCSRPPDAVVVIYTSFDEVHARAVFDAFRAETGIAVAPVYDTEEAKTLGLVHRLIEERRRPQADVYWSGEAARTALLAERGVLDPFRPATADDIPPRWRDAGGRWTGFAARARVIVYNTKSVRDPPRTLEDLADPRWRGRVAVAHPRFGTTAAHVLALRQSRGEEWTLDFLASLARNGARVTGGNSHVRDLVARGDCDAGLTDTDDVWIGRARGDSIDMVFPDQDGAGTLVIPNTVALVRGAPHPEPARRLIEFLLRPGTEALLARGPSKQMPVRRDVRGPEGAPGLHEIRALAVDWSRIGEDDRFLEKAAARLQP